jgi:hypothetical protein
MEVRPPSRQRRDNTVGDARSTISPIPESLDWDQILYGVKNCIETINSRVIEFPEVHAIDLQRINKILASRETLKKRLKSLHEIRADKNKEIQHYKMHNETIQHEIDHLIKGRMRSSQQEDLTESIQILKSEIEHMKKSLSKGMNELIIRTNGDFV